MNKSENDQPRLFQGFPVDALPYITAETLETLTASLDGKGLPIQVWNALNDLRMRVHNAVMDSPDRLLANQQPIGKLLGVLSDD